MVEYDGGRKPDQGGPSLAAVLDDLATLPLLAPRRVVLVREADPFITAHREALERYLTKPPPAGTLILECRSFPRTTRLFKAATAVGGQIVECKHLMGRALLDFVISHARSLEKRLSAGAARRIVELTGTDTGLLAAEVEKLALYVGDRPAISEEDVADLVAPTREEKVFSAVEAAAGGRSYEALRLWRQVLETDPEAVYKALGGLTWKLRQWLTAHRLLREGNSLSGIAPKVGMWGRETELEKLLNRMPAQRLRSLLAAAAELDSQVKSSLRSIENGVEALLLRLAAPD